MRVLQEATISRTCETIYQKLGLTEEDSKTATRCVVRAMLRGNDEWGLGQVLEHFSLIRSKKVSPRPRFRIASEFDSAVVLDGGRGLGSVVGTKAMLMAIRKAKKSGACWVYVKNAGDFGMASNYAMLALDHDCIGIVMANTLPWVAPYGGHSRALGANPLCFAMPTEREIPIVFDAATSTVAPAKVRAAYKRGATMPGDWALDSSGRPTADPRQAIKGALTPLGGYKGFGLGLAIELITGTLSQIPLAGIGGPEAESPPMGQAFVALDVGAFVDTKEFKTKLDDLVREIKLSAVRPGFQEIILPGERAARTEKERAASGIPVDDEIWRRIQEISGVLGLGLQQ
jgi:LDH2 family malate/lactate/ureidoglycolate dehydrogenase